MNAKHLIFVRSFNRYNTVSKGQKKMYVTNIKFIEDKY